MKIGLQCLRLEALESFQNLRAFEYSGSTIAHGRTFGRYPIPEPDNWDTVHRSTLEKLLRIILEYCRRLHSKTDLQVALLHLIDLDIPDFPPQPKYITFEETHECTESMHTSYHPDIRALEMVTIDALVDRIYEDRLIKQDLHGFVTRVPILCAYFRTPLFHTTQAKFYEMVVQAFDQRPNRDQIPWDTTPAIHI
jgi:hypothetical protein